MDQPLLQPGRPQQLSPYAVARLAPDSDHTVKVEVTGLEPYTRYWYRFRAEGETSPVGRTQTAPDEAGRLQAWSSCARR